MSEHEYLEPREAIEAMLNGETLYYYNDKFGDCELKCWFDKGYGDRPSCFITDFEAGYILKEFSHCYRKPAPKKRLMTCFEVMQWIKEGSNGWVVKHALEDNWHSPEYLIMAISDNQDGSFWRRAKIKVDAQGKWIGVDENTITNFTVEE